MLFLSDFVIHSQLFLHSIDLPFPHYHYALAEREALRKFRFLSYQIEVFIAGELQRDYRQFASALNSLSSRLLREDRRFCLQPDESDSLNQNPKSCRVYRLCLTRLLFAELYRILSGDTAYGQMTVLAMEVRLLGALLLERSWGHLVACCAPEPPKPPKFPSGELDDLLAIPGSRTRYDV